VEWFSLTPQTAPFVLKKLEATFAKVDTNGSGEIDDEELCQILATFFKAAAVEMVKKQVKKLIDTYDKNKNGVLEFVGELCSARLI
jgi:Ca2+-binding EF-hand superfamily protein